VLPLIALIAAIIAHRPIWLKTVTIEGLGVFEHMFKGMWEQIPDRTPVVGRHWVLDGLVEWPFAEFRDAGGGEGKKGGEGEGEGGMADIEELFLDRTRICKRKREGNMWGLRTKMQWQTHVS
jgi:hypothetical protein